MEYASQLMAGVFPFCHTKRLHLNTNHMLKFSALRVLLGQETDPTGTLQSIRASAQEIVLSAEMNRIRWPIYPRSDHWVDTGETLEENVAYIEAFLIGRMEFLSDVWGEK